MNDFKKGLENDLEIKNKLMGIKSGVNSIADGFPFYDF
jgi:hypothetical protein